MRVRCEGKIKGDTSDGIGVMRQEGEVEGGKVQYVLVGARERESGDVRGGGRMIQTDSLSGWGELK